MWYGLQIDLRPIIMAHSFLLPCNTELGHIKLKTGSFNVWCDQVAYVFLFPWRYLENA